MRDTWTELNSGVYVATIVFAYLCFVMFLLFFVALILFQGAVSDELGIAAADGGAPAAAALPLRNPFAAHQAKYEAAYPFGPPAQASSGYDSPSRIPAIRTGGGGGAAAAPHGGGAMQQTASPLPPPQQQAPMTMMMAMPTPLPGAGGPFAMQQGNAI